MLVPEAAPSGSMRRAGALAPTPLAEQGGAGDYDALTSATMQETKFQLGSADPSFRRGRPLETGKAKP